MADLDISSKPRTQPLSPPNSDSGQDETMDATRIKDCLLHAGELKLQGNDHFREKQWQEALVSYRTGLARLPLRKDRGKGKEKEKTEELDPPSEEEGEAADKPKDPETRESGDVEDIESNDEDQVECAKARAIMNANIAACHVKLGDHKEAVNSCTEALLDDPKYIKALQRRAASNEKIDSWPSLTSAQEDYTSLLEILPPSSPQLAEVKRSLHLLKPRVEQAQKRETGEMLDKLKGLGNSLLGNFGLSTDNFKFEPNGQGGYSMNFVR